LSILMLSFIDTATVLSILMLSFIEQGQWMTTLKWTIQ
jgi:hypothetical protein